MTAAGRLTMAVTRAAVGQLDRRCRARPRSAAGWRCRRMQQADDIAGPADRDGRRAHRRIPGSGPSR